MGTRISEEEKTLRRKQILEGLALNALGAGPQPSPEAMDLYDQYCEGEFDHEELTKRLISRYRVDISQEIKHDICYCNDECEHIDCFRHRSKMPDEYGISYAYLKNRPLCPYYENESVGQI